MADDALGEGATKDGALPFSRPGERRRELRRGDIAVGRRQQRAGGCPE